MMAAEPARSHDRSAGEDYATKFPPVTDHHRRIMALRKWAHEHDWRPPVRVEPGWQDEARKVLEESFHRRHEDERSAER